MPIPALEKATIKDLPEIVLILAQDSLGQVRECPQDPVPVCYEKAFYAIQNDPNNHLIVAKLDGKVVGCLQLTFTPTLTYQGAWRATIEGVRVAPLLRHQGIGSHMLEYAIRKARLHGCKIVQVTTDKRRTTALRFYERLGFSPTHEGLKLFLQPQ